MNENTYRDELEQRGTPGRAEASGPADPRGSGSRTSLQPSRRPQALQTTVGLAVVPAAVVDLAVLPAPAVVAVAEPQHGLIQSVTSTLVLNQYGAQAIGRLSEFALARLGHDDDEM